MKHSRESMPFAQLGSTLRALRQRKKESVAEAAGAVEIGEEELQQMEQGTLRPSEEILLLLINHFGMKEEEAVRLWELAGYDQSDDDADTDEGHHTGKTIVMAIAMDPRVMYSDSVQVQGNQHGVVLNFMQPGPAQMPGMPISRIGMSRDQAKKMIEVLQETLNHLDAFEKPKELPAQIDEHQKET